MKHLIYLLICIFLANCKIESQEKINSFPDKASFLPAEFAKHDNINLLAVLDRKSEGIDNEIPIFYSFASPGIDSSVFYIKGDYIDQYSYVVEGNGKYKPMFSIDALRIQSDYEKYFEKGKSKIDSFKRHGELKKFIKFHPEPDWWQSDQTPYTKDGAPFKFICQLELYDITDNDGMLYIFYDKENKLIKYVYQWD